MSVPSNLKPWERAIVFQYIFNLHRLPPWSEDELDAFAAITGESREWAKKAFERAVRCGYMERTK